NDIVDRRLIARQLPPAVGHPPAKANQAVLTSCLFGSDGGRGQFQVDLTGGLQSPPFDPAVLIAGRWRPLVVHVTPQAIRAWWDGKPLRFVTKGRVRDSITPAEVSESIENHRW